VAVAVVVMLVAEIMIIELYFRAGMVVDTVTRLNN
jgi:hypothetical protein